MTSRCAGGVVPNCATHKESTYKEPLTSSSMASLNEKVETLTVQLGLTRGAPFAQAIAQALKMLGLEERASNLNLVEKADLCLATLGSTPSSSATAPSQPAPVVVQGAVVVPSSNAEPPMGLVLPTGPSSYGQPAYGGAMPAPFAQPAVAPAPQQIAPAPHPSYGQPAYGGAVHTPYGQPAIAPAPQPMAAPAPQQVSLTGS